MEHYKKLALAYHKKGRPGKIRVVPTKPCVTQSDLALAYTPGVAEPCLEIAEDKEKVFDYTNRGNLVAVVSNGSAVLGLGNIGPEAGKPVMEGKGVLFSRFAGIDVFDIEVDSQDPDEIIRLCELIAPGFGGINLEDIKAPECFEIERQLIDKLDIPVFHDDQHGTAIISAAALINGLHIVEKNIEDVKVVFNGAGAAGIACCSHFITMGVRKENVILCDSRGVIYKGRQAGLNKYKAPFAAETDARTLADAMVNADVFCGVSVKDVVTPEMILSMANDPLVLAMANPDAEIEYNLAVKTRSDIIMATGRSDHPNQVNNVLGFPFIFRGALDVRARKVTENMKVAATKALASLAREDVPEIVSRAYGGQQLRFGREYIIPKPFDPRALTRVAIAVAKAAVKDGVARNPIADWEAYAVQLEQFIDPTRWLVSSALREVKAKASPRIVFPDGDSTRVLQACSQLAHEKICKPVILGDPKQIELLTQQLEITLDGCEILDPRTMDRELCAKRFYERRQRKGLTLQDARVELRNPNVLAVGMVHYDQVDAMISGALHSYPWTIRPALKIIGLRDDISSVCGIHVMIWEKRTLLFADTAINPNPTAEMLADFAVLAADLASSMNLVPKIAFLSVSNFGSYRNEESQRMTKALELAQKRMPDVQMDGEMQADTAVSPEIAEQWFPFSKINGDANILIFPNLSAGNIAYKIARELGGARSIGPILMGLNKPVNVLHRTATVDEIIDITTLTVRKWQKEKANTVPTC